MRAGLGVLMKARLVGAMAKPAWELTQVDGQLSQTHFQWLGLLFAMGRA